MKYLLLCSFLLRPLIATDFSIENQVLFNKAGSHDESPLLDLHRSLIEIPSVTGSEHKVSKFLGEYLRNHGFNVELQPVVDGRENVLAYLGDRRETRILITSHIDTVPPFIPYERRGDEIWGRGSVDAKGSVAAQITAFQTLYHAGRITEGDVALLFVVGEEFGGHGMKAANRLGLSWESVIFGEPTELKLAAGHKGVLGFQLSAHGIAGHSGYPELGRSAIEVLVRGLSALLGLELPGSEEYGNTTLNIGQIEGGVAGNVIAENASATVLVRVASNDVSGIRSRIEDTIAAVSPWLQIDFLHHGIGPVRIDSDVEGFETIVVNYGTDVPSLQGTHKRYLYGPGTILLAHSDHEHVNVSDLYDAVDGYQNLVTQLLSRPRV